MENKLTMTVNKALHVTNNETKLTTGKSKSFQSMKSQKNEGNMLGLSFLRQIQRPKGTKLAVSCNLTHTGNPTRLEISFQPIDSLDVINIVP